MTRKETVSHSTDIHCNLVCARHCGSIGDTEKYSSSLIGVYNETALINVMMLRERETGGNGSSEPGQGRRLPDSSYIDPGV